MGREQKNDENTNINIIRNTKKTSTQNIRRGAKLKNLKNEPNNIYWTIKINLMQRTKNDLLVDVGAATQGTTKQYTKKQRCI